MGARIFIVEDEQIVAADLETKLKRLGHQVVGTSTSGEEALRLIPELNPGLVLMDIRIQGDLDGLEVARRLQAMMGTPVVFITAYAEVFFADPAQTVPPAVYLSKPFSVAQLRSVLDAVIGSNQPF